jgi:hypothetical protein
MQNNYDLYDVALIYLADPSKHNFFFTFCPHKQCNLIFFLFDFISVAQAVCDFVSITWAEFSLFQNRSWVASKQNNQTFEVYYF